VHHAPGCWDAHSLKKGSKTTEQCLRMLLKPSSCQGKSTQGRRHQHGTRVYTYYCEVHYTDCYELAQLSSSSIAVCEFATTHQSQAESRLPKFPHAVCNTPAAATYIMINLFLPLLWGAGPMALMLWLNLVI
jgi:hypothetical protein